VTGEKIRTGVAARKGGCGSDDGGGKVGGGDDLSFFLSLFASSRRLPSFVA